MKKTFLCDESMIITIPLGNLKDAREGHLMPDKFQCVFRDPYKIFVHRGKPIPLGAAQAIAGVFIITLAAYISYKTCALPSLLFVVTGIITFAAGKIPNMHVTKLSFSLNIICVFWSIAAACIFATMTQNGPCDKVCIGIKGLIWFLLFIEKILAIFLIYWLSKAVCREHFNTLPFILLKQGD